MQMEEGRDALGRISCQKQRCTEGCFSFSFEFTGLELWTE